MNKDSTGDNDGHFGIAKGGHRPTLQVVFLA